VRRNDELTGFMKSFMPQSDTGQSPRDYAIAIVVVTLIVSLNVFLLYQTFFDG
jgi:hypothetical protein